MNTITTLPFREALRYGDDELKQYVVDFFESSGWRTEETLEGIMRSDDFYANEMVTLKVPSLFKGRFVILGEGEYALALNGGVQRVWSVACANADE